MAKDHKIKDLHEKIDLLNTSFATKLIEKEKEIYATIIDYFIKLGHDMNPFTQNVIDKPTNSSNLKKPPKKSSTNKKNIAKKSSIISPETPDFTDYFKVISEPDNSILLNEPEKTLSKSPKSTTTPVKKGAQKKALNKATSPKKVVAKKTRAVKKATFKTQNEKLVPKKAPIKTSVAKKVATKKPITKAASKKVSIKAVSANKVRKSTTKK